MKQWIIKNSLWLMGATVGAVAGFFYWKFIGCSGGTCMITSSPRNSTLYFAVMGGLLFNLFKRTAS